MPLAARHSARASSRLPRTAAVFFQPRQVRAAGRPVRGGPRLLLVLSEGGTGGDGREGGPVKSGRYRGNVAGHPARTPRELRKLLRRGVPLDGGYVSTARRYRSIRRRRRSIPLSRRPNTNSVFFTTPRATWNSRGNTCRTIWRPKQTNRPRRPPSRLAGHYHQTARTFRPAYSDVAEGSPLGPVCARGRRNCGRLWLSSRFLRRHTLY